MCTTVKHKNVSIAVIQKMLTNKCLNYETDVYNNWTMIARMKENKEGGGKVVEMED